MGPRADGDVEALAALLRAPDVRDRLKIEAARIQAMFMAKLDPPKAATGREFFFGKTPLISGIEKPGYRIMEPHYRWRPITKQEAVRTAKYLSTLDPKTARAGWPAFAALDYTAFRPMVEHQFRKLLTEAHERWPLQRVRVVHRLGVVADPR